MPPAIGFPEGDHIAVSKSDWAALGGYLDGVRNWMEAAAECLNADGRL